MLRIQEEAWAREFIRLHSNKASASVRTNIQMSKSESDSGRVLVRSQSQNTDRTREIRLLSRAKSGRGEMLHMKLEGASYAEM
jgi:hypothetical protein